jgi:hypothetical protein
MGRSVPLVGIDRPGQPGSAVPRCPSGAARIWRPGTTPTKSMKSFTTSNYLNLRTVYRFNSHPPDPPGNGVRPGEVRRGKALAGRADYPSPAEIEQLTQQIVLAILAASRGAAPRNPAD